jgi:hypothetical protein
MDEDLSQREYLRMAVAHTHRCGAKWVETVQVRERVGATTWNADVNVFAIDHPQAKLCYAWSEVSGNREGSNRFVTILGAAPVDSAVAAVKAAAARAEA